MNDNTIIELEALKVEALVIGYPSDEPICAEYRAIAAKIRALKQDETQPPAEPPGSPMVREEDDPVPDSAEDAVLKRRECYTVWSQEGKLILAEATKKAVRRLTTMVLLDTDITRMVELGPGERIVSGEGWICRPSSDCSLLDQPPSPRSAPAPNTRKIHVEQTELLRRAYKTLAHIAEHCPQDGTRRMAAGDADRIAAALGIGDDND